MEDLFFSCWNCNHRPTARNCGYIFRSRSLLQIESSCFLHVIVWFLFNTKSGLIRALIIKCIFQLSIHFIFAQTKICKQYDLFFDLGAHNKFAYVIRIRDGRDIFFFTLLLSCFISFKSWFRRNQSTQDTFCITILHFRRN